MSIKQELIKTIIIDEANLEYIAKSKTINGTLLVEIERVMDIYAKQAFNAAKEGKVEKEHVLIDQYGSTNIEEHFVPKYPTFEDYKL